MVRASRIERCGAIVLRAVPIAVDPAERARLIADAVRRRGPNEAETQLMQRLATAGVAATFEDLAADASHAASRVGDIDLMTALRPQDRRALDKDCAV